MKRIDFEELDLSEDGSICIYEGAPFSGIAYEKDVGGRLVSEVSFVDGLRDGALKLWHPSGAVKAEEGYLKGSKHGPSRTWFKNGNLARKAEFEFGIVVSEEVWDEHGNPVKQYHLTSDHPQYLTLQRMKKLAK